MMRSLRIMVPLAALVTFLLTLTPPTADAQRPMENLDRGVVAIRTSATDVFISWRLLGLDPSGIGFNLYRSEVGETPVKLNSSVLTGGTNYTDSSANLSMDNDYFVRPVINGLEQEASGSFTLPANAATEPVVVVPMRNGAEVHFAWVGDLDADGEYDFIVDRLDWGNPFKIEAYNRDGTFLWEVDYGPNSLNQNNIEGGSSVIDVGHWDGVTVYDLNNDGRAEVITKIADGVTFGDGETWTHSDDDRQWIAVLDGMTGALLDTAPIPQDYIEHGPMMAQLGVGWVDGENRIFVHMKNRRDNGWFNTIACNFYWDGSELVQRWKSLEDGDQGHQIRICDVNGDGHDDLCHIGFVLDGLTGAKLYDVDGVVHGDRWHIGKFDPNREGLQLWGVQQNNSSGLTEFYADARNGDVLWQHISGGGDVGRGDVADIDPRHLGYEGWSFEGVYNLPTNTQTGPGDTPWPVLRLWWDGDILAEQYNDGKIEEWDYVNGGEPRLLSTWHFQSATGSARGAPMFYGDILGDWREEVVMTSADYSDLLIFTTTHPTDTRIYTMPHNPYYRNDMTVKGYMQSHQLDYYLGDDMTMPPPAPDIQIVDPDCLPLSITPHAQVDGGPSIETDEIKVFAGQSATLSPQTGEAGDWNWEGPDGLTAETQELELNNIQMKHDGEYVVTFTRECGAVGRHTFRVIVKRLVAHYEFESGTEDSSADNNHAQSSGNPAYTAGPADFGQAVSLDGTDDVLSLPGDAVAWNEMTVAAWVNWNGGDAWQRVFDFGNNTTEYMFLTPRSGDDTLRFAITTSGNGGEQILETSQLSTNEWVHLAVTLEGEIGTLYLNGATVDTKSNMTLNTADFNPLNNYIGQSQWPDPLFSGRIDEFRIYNYALPPTAIETLLESVPESRALYWTYLE